MLHLCVCWENSFHLSLQRPCFQWLVVSDFALFSNIICILGCSCTFLHTFYCLEMYRYVWKFHLSDNFILTALCNSIWIIVLQTDRTFSWRYFRRCTCIAREKSQYFLKKIVHMFLSFSVLDIHLLFNFHPLYCIVLLM